MCRRVCLLSFVLDTPSLAFGSRCQQALDHVLRTGELLARGALHLHCVGLRTRRQTKQCTPATMYRAKRYRRHLPCTDAPALPTATSVWPAAPAAPCLQTPAPLCLPPLRRTCCYDGVCADKEPGAYGPALGRVAVRVCTCLPALLSYVGHVLRLGLGEDQQSQGREWVRQR